MRPLLSHGHRQQSKIQTDTVIADLGRGSDISRRGDVAKRVREEVASESRTETEETSHEGMVGRGHQLEGLEPRREEKSWGRHGRKGQWLWLERERQGGLVRMTRERLRGPGQTI